MITKQEFGKFQSLGVPRVITLAVILLSLHPDTRHVQDSCGIDGHVRFVSEGVCLRADVFSFVGACFISARIWTA